MVSPASPDPSKLSYTTSCALQVALIIDEDGDGRIEYDEYVKWKTEDAGKYGEKESAFTAAHAEMWTQIRERAEMNRPSGARPLNTTGL